MPVRSQSDSSPVHSVLPGDDGRATRQSPLAADIVESLSDPVVAFDRSYRYTFVSRRAAEALGKKPEDMVGKSMWELFPCDADPGFRETCERAWAEGRSITLERYSNVLGRWIEASICPLDNGASVQWRDVGGRKQTEMTQAFLAECEWVASGQDVFQALARRLGESLGMDYVCIDRLEPEGLSARTVAVYFDGKFEDNVTYTLKDTPCGQVVQDQVCCFPKDVRHLFPKDEALQGMGAESYVGTVLWDSRRRPIGLLAVIGRRPLANPRQTMSIVGLVGLLAARELERRQYEDELRASEEVARRRAEELEQLTRRQSLLSEVLTRLLASEAPQTIVNDLAGKVMELLDCHVFFNYLVDSGGNRLRLNACAGIPDETAREIATLDFGVAVCGCVAQLGSRIIAENIPETADPRTDLVKSFGVKAYACHPLVSGGAVIGTLSFGSKSRTRFSAEDIDLMRAVSDHIALAMERARSRESLQRSEALYRGIARSIPEGLVCAVDAGMRCIAIGGDLAAKWGMESEKVEGRPLLDAVDENLRPAVEAHFRLALAGITASYETEVRGGFVWSQYTPLREENGALIGAMLLAIDISERKRAEERLRQAQKLESVGLLAGGIAHDFNNILTGVMGNASLLLDGVNSEQADMVQSIISSTERAAHLTRQLLAYSGKGQFVMREIDISEAVNETADLVQFSIPKSVRLKLDLERRLPAVKMDPGQLQQVLMNLVINAGEAIGEGNSGSITVSTSMADVKAPFIDAIGEEIGAGRYACVEVTDTGGGIDAHQRARIFDPFFTTKFFGRGLGLAAVAGIVRSQKGGIALASEPGKGTSFRVFLPTVGGGAEHSAEAGAANGRPTVMIVDDESAVRAFIGAVLRRKGYNVLTASDGEEALALCPPGDGRLDAAIVDIVMPNMGANDLLPALRARRPGARILLTSGYSELEARRLCAAYPSATFIQKPYTAQQIAKAVADLLEGVVAN